MISPARMKKGMAMKVIQIEALVVAARRHHQEILAADLDQADHTGQRPV